MRDAVDISQQTLQKMGDAIRHRGPDGEGVWIDTEADIGLVHRRLSIIDISSAGHQPMASPFGRFVMVFNGEIYNHQALRAQLEEEGNAPSPWRGTSDSETLSVAIESWGVDKALQALVGMFAIALWDRENRLLHLIRDRLGEKPLYYGIQNGVFLFGSELKALRCHPAFDGKVDTRAADAMLRLGYVPAPFSIYKEIHKLPPGCKITIKADRKGNLVVSSPQSYWSVKRSYSDALEQGLFAPEDDHSKELETLLQGAICDQMIADVPLGVFLSGGIDSTLITALAQAQSVKPIQSFTIGFDVEGFNEAEDAKAIATHLGTDHTELYVTPHDALDVIPGLPQIFDEPFADASQIPTHILCKMARQHVTVSLSGDGGDELFGGYNRHVGMAGFAGKINTLPRPIRKAIAAMLLAIPQQRLESLTARLSKRFGTRFDLGHIARKIQKVASIFSSQNDAELYAGFIESDQPYGSHTHTTHGVKSFSGIEPLGHVEGLVEDIMLQDMLGYLPDDVLVKVDRSAMGVSLETRAPFLDHRVVAFSHRVPLSRKISKGRGKMILREILHRHVPPVLIDRPKMGFGVPIDVWLRGPLREWAEDLLSVKRLQDDPFLASGPLRRMMEEHQSGAFNWQGPLWSALMFQSWRASNE